jgi:hypothetical protein
VVRVFQVRGFDPVVRGSVAGADHPVGALLDQGFPNLSVTPNFHKLRKLFPR